MMLGAVPGFFASAVSAFFNASDFRPSTAQTYRCALLSFFSYCQKQQIEKPEPFHLMAWRDELLLLKRPATVQTYLTVLKQFFRWTASRDIYRDIGLGIRGLRIHRFSGRDFVPVSGIRKVLKRLWSSGRRRDYLMIVLMVCCGLRVSEVVRLDKDDLFRIGHQWVIAVHGKGRDGKSDMVTVDDGMARAMVNYLNGRRKTAMQTMPFFVSDAYRNRGGRLSARTVSRIVKNALMDAGFRSARLTAHSLRHSAVTFSLQAGASLQEAQQFARHSRIETTQIYAHNLERLRNRCSSLVMKMVFNAGKRFLPVGAYPPC